MVNSKPTKALKAKSHVTFAKRQGHNMQGMQIKAHISRMLSIRTFTILTILNIGTPVPCLFPKPDKVLQKPLAKPVI